MIGSKPAAGLVLTGGGARAAYQVGVLSALAEILPQKSLPFRVLSGTSAGAINIAYLASHAADWPAAAHALRALWHSLRLERIYRTDGFSLGAIAAGWVSRTLLGGKAGTRKAANYLLDTQPLRELLLSQIPFDAIPDAISSGLLQGVSFTATHYFKSRSISFFDAHADIQEWVRSNRLGVRARIHAEHVMASSSIPVFFPPVVIDGHAYGDGCLRQTTPLSPAIHLGADRLLCVGIRHERSSHLSAFIPLQNLTSPSLAQIGGELMNALFLDSLESDIERMERINQTLASVDKATRAGSLKDLRAIPVLSLCPSRDLGELSPKMLKRFPFFMRHLLRGLGTSELEGSDMLSYLTFEPHYLDPLMDLGYHDTLAKRDIIERFMSS